jgi:predicted O-linked N-acetylglucosamine transferase (SPINDLY family)
LRTIGLDEFIASDPEEFVTIARRFATSPDDLTKVRMGLREQMRLSPLCDGPRFTRNLEQKFRETWQEWCLNRSR